MNKQNKELLLTLIKGLTKIKNDSQYYEGEKYIDEDGIQILKNAIENM